MASRDEKQAGEIGRDMAKAMATKIIETISHFPASSGVQRAAITRLLNAELLRYAQEEEAA